MHVSILLPLLRLASPTLPIGGFSYSEGLEAAIHAGHVHDEATTAAWLIDQLWLGQVRADWSILAEALPAWRLHDWERLAELDTWVRTTRETEELQLQATQMGRSLIEWAKTLHDDRFAPDIRPARLQQPTFPVAYALALSTLLPAHDPVDKLVLPAVTAAAFAWCENLVQAAIKSVPLGQGAGQRILAQLCDEIPLAVDAAISTTDASRQSFTPMLAILSAQHEHQYSRLFRS